MLLLLVTPKPSTLAAPPLLGSNGYAFRVRGYLLLLLLLLLQLLALRRLPPPARGQVPARLPLLRLALPAGREAQAEIECERVYVRERMYGVWCMV